MGGFREKGSHALRAGARISDHAAALKGLTHVVPLQGGIPKAVSLLTSDISRVEAGQEITISYGENRSNEELLHLYGGSLSN